MPEKWFVPAYMFNFLICCDVTFILISTLRGVVYGETAGESRGNEKYRREAKERNEVNFIPFKVIIYLIHICIQEFINPYDCGSVVIALQNSLRYSRSTY